MEKQKRELKKSQEDIASRKAELKTLTAQKIEFQAMVIHDHDIKMKS